MVFGGSKLFAVMEAFGELGWEKQKQLFCESIADLLYMEHTLSLQMNVSTPTKH